MKPLVVANWKLNPITKKEAEDIFNGIKKGVKDTTAEVVVCPPFVFLPLLKELTLGAQNVYFEEKGAFTGEISGAMLKNLGVEYVIIGHSERRWKLGESNETVNQKLKTTLRNGFIPIVCIGERVRDDNFEKFLEGQITGTFEGLSADEIGKCIIAYEPVGAISTNPGARPDTPASALESIYIIKEVLAKTYNLKPNNLVLYGGSVNSKNVRDFLGEEEIDGVLVGGASVNKEEFVKILEITASLK